MSRRALVLAVLTGAALLMTAPVSGAAQAPGSAKSSLRRKACGKPTGTAFSSKT